MYLDEQGNITQSNGDGGDSAQRTGFLGSVLELRRRLEISNTEFLASTPWTFERQWPTLFTPSKRLIRNPRDGDSIPKWNDPKDTSRDQSTPMIIALGLRGIDDAVKACSPKGFILKFYPNWDPASPNDLNVVRRAREQEPTALGDFWLAQSIALHLRKTSSKLDDVGDDLNWFLTLAFSFIVKPTDTSTAALKRYLTERSANFGNLKLGIKDPVLAALSWYHRPKDCFRAPNEAGGNPELANICADLISSLRWHLGCTIR